MPSRTHSGHYFPCPVCAARLEVRITKKQKPYLVCDPCGVQLFVRSRSGIERFAALVDRAESGNALDRLAEMESRYHKKCPECGKSFWTAPELLETDWLDGEPIGFKCPEEDCDGVVKLENAE
ncbi:MAG: hypothetical protein L0387_27315 [Acidobacteria bacterium]|nr:hypothetical protein [Acidobacteriota bacterium]